jgi:hypothetical protein
MEFDLAAELNEMAAKREAEFERKKAAALQERVAKKRRRDYGLAQRHAQKLARLKEDQA